MERKLSDKIKIVEQGDNSDIVYIGVDGTPQNLRFNASGIYANSTNSILTTAMPLAYSSAFQTATLAGSLMPLAYSSGFQTATLASTFLPVANLAFGNIVSFSWTSTVNGVSTTMYLKTA